MHPALLPIALLLLLAGTAPLPAQTVTVFTADTLVGAANLAYEGHAITVRGCTLTVDGAHAFHSLTIERNTGNKAGVLTHSAGFNQGGVSGCFLTIAGDVLVQGASGGQVGSRIDLDGKGYGEGQGPGASPATQGQSSGAGHGGNGGWSYSQGAAGKGYGSATAPADLGSGAGSTAGYGQGGPGGGAIRLLVGGKLTLEGAITAKGLPGTSHGGGGSGGSLFLTAGTIAGSGVIGANGGAYTTGGYGGGGGGGRIAIHYGASTFTGTHTAAGAIGRQYGGAGTIFTKGTADPQGWLLLDNAGKAGAVTELRAAFWPAATPHLVVDRQALAHPYEPLTFASLAVTNGGAMSHDAGQNLFDLTIQQDALVDAQSRIDADGKGYGEGQGPGASPANQGQTGGAGYGGDGGWSYGQAAGGNGYGSATAPADLGSGAGGTSGYGRGGSGGGAVRLRVGGKLTVEGAITAKGLPGTNQGGGGSGGSLNLTVGSFAGSGSLDAGGGSYVSGAYGGGGGGGRIAVHYGASTFAGTLIAAGAIGRQYGGAGTIFTKGTADPQGRLLLDNAGKAGAVTELRAAFWPAANPHLVVDRQALAHPYDPLAFASLAVTNGGTMSHDAGQKTFDVTILQDALVDAQSRIDADGKGFGEGQGPGASPANLGQSGGAGHGGNGGASYTNAPGGTTYGSVTAPDELGSGAGATTGYGAGGPGGGAVRLQVGGKLTLDGAISAEGLSGTSHGGGGAGGSIHLTLGILAGSGSISAAGGAYVSGAYGGGGAGGRIAVYHGTTTFAGTLSATGAPGRQRGAAGTVLRKTAAEAYARVAIDNGGVLGAVTELRPSFWPPSVFFHLQVRGKADIQTFDPMTMASLALTGEGRMSHEAGRNAFDVVVLEDATIDATSTIVADGRGHPEATGPGASPDAIGGTGGAGHGGPGGAGYSTGRPGGPVYGYEKAPVDLGSGAGRTTGYGTGGAGGGAIRLNVVGKLTVDGTVSVNGMRGTNHGGGGSGGSIYFTVGAFAGAGTLAARGGDYVSGAYGGGGGGGRVAVYYGASTFAGTVDVAGGAGRTAGGKGTVYLQQGVAPPWSYVRNGDFEAGVLPPWGLAGGGQNPLIAPFDVTGLATTRAFGVDAETTPAVLRQQVLLAAGSPYLLLADLAAFSAAGDPDGGQWEIYVGGQKVDADQLGIVAAGKAARRHVCVAFAAAVNGLQDLEIRIFRNGAAGPVRTWLDNVRIHDAAYPILCIRQPRLIGTTVGFHVAGTANAPFFMLLSPFVLGGGLKVPWASGVWYLSPVMLTPLFYGSLSGSGGWSTNLPIPNDPVLVGVDLYFQGLELHPATLAPAIGALALYPLVK